MKKIYEMRKAIGALLRPCVFRRERLPSIAQGLWTPRCRLRSHIYSLTFLTLWHVHDTSG